MGLQLRGRDYHIPPVVPCGGLSVVTSLKKKWIKFRDTVLLPAWYYQRCNATNDGKRPVIVRCWCCNAGADLGLVNGKWKLSPHMPLNPIDPGHIKRRGSHPELICDINNIRPECRMHNSQAAGQPQWSKK